MAQVTLNSANVRSLFDSARADPRLENQLAAERVSRADAPLMRLPVGVYLDVEYRPSASERSQRRIFEHVVSRLYAAQGPELSRLLDAPDVAQLWAQWQLGQRVLFPRRLTLSPAKSARPRPVRRRSPLDAAFVRQQLPPGI
ncbi:MAG: hypothetical protein AAFY60_13550 [Myxococcota bacterium]